VSNPPDLDLLETQGADISREGLEANNKPDAAADDVLS